MSISKSGDLTLRTARLVLRGPRPDDLDAMFAVFSDPAAMRYWSTAPHADRSVTSEMLDRHIARWADQPHYFQFTLNGAWIGCGGHVRGGEIGFMLSPAHWRKGYVTEAMGAIIPYLWQNTDLPALTADADPLNAASCGLLTSLGFHETHRARNTFCINGVWSDSVYFRLDRPTG